MSTEYKDGPRELVLNRLLDASPAKIWRAWTEPELMKQWFCPAPWKVTEAKIDLRPGGASYVLMQGPEGQEFPNYGQYLEVVKEKKIVFTDAYLGDWKPSEKPFFTAIVTMEAEGGKTRYIARALHWTDEACEQHKQMGFHDGWGKAADQLEELCRRL